MSTIAIYIFQISITGFDLDYADGSSMDPGKKLHIIMIALLIEHISSYFIQYFRHYDIENYGELDI